MAIADVNYDDCERAYSAYQEFIGLVKQERKRGYLSAIERGKLKDASLLVGAFLEKITNRGG